MTALAHQAPDVATTVADLRTTFAAGRTRSREWRDAQLAGLDRLISERADELIAALGEDLRRTDFESIMFDLVSVKPEIKHARKHLKKWMKPRRVPTPVNVKPGKAWVQHEPLGVVMVIGAWNYPFFLIASPLVAALAAGNCVVIKPSEIAPRTSAVLAALVPQYLDPDAVRVVEGAADTTLSLIDQGLDHILFTGSPQVGAVIMEAASKHLTPVTLELGGKCPVIVTASARLDVAARRIAFGKLTNSGQTCVAPDYVLVDAAVKDAFLEQLTSTLAEFSAGVTKPIVNQRHATRIAGLLESAGGQVVLGGEVDLADATIAPTVVVDPTPGSAIMTEEIFGPVLPVVTVSGIDAAIAHVVRGTKPLASYVFTEDAGDREKALAGFSSGATVFNNTMMHLAVHDLPFGGVGTSGTGNYHGHWGFETFSHARAVLRQQTRIDVKLMYPPYSDRFQKMLRKQL